MLLKKGHSALTSCGTAKINNGRADNAWLWTIELRDLARYPCPSSAALFGTFAAVNSVVSLLGIMTGNRNLTKWAMLGWLSQRNAPGFRLVWASDWSECRPSACSWRLTPVNATLVRKQADYVVGFSVGRVHAVPDGRQPDFNLAHPDLHLSAECLGR